MKLHGNLLKKGIYVYLGSRNLENGIEAVNKLLAEGLSNVEAIQLDITDAESVKKCPNRDRQEEKNVGHTYQ